MQEKPEDRGWTGGIPESRYQNVNKAEELLLRRRRDGQDKAHTAQHRMSNQMTISITEPRSSGQTHRHSRLAVS